MMSFPGHAHIPPVETVLVVYLICRHRFAEPMFDYKNPQTLSTASDSLSELFYTPALPRCHGKL